MVAVVSTALWVGELTRTRAVELQAGLTTKLRIATVLVDLRDAETGQRGFLLTHDPGYLTPFDRARSSLPKELDDLQSALRDEGVSDDIRGLRLASDAKMSELERTVALARMGRVDDATQIMLTGRGRSLMDQARSELVALDDAADSRTALSVQRLRSSSGWLRVVTVAGSIIALAFAATAILTVLRYVTDLTRARQALAKLNA